MEPLRSSTVKIKNVKKKLIPLAKPCANSKKKIGKKKIFKTPDNIYVYNVMNQ